jgi:hypothetical protein
MTKTFTVTFTISELQHHFLKQIMKIEKEKSLDKWIQREIRGLIPSIAEFYWDQGKITEDVDQRKISRSRK